MLHNAQRPPLDTYDVVTDPSRQEVIQPLAAKMWTSEERASCRLAYRLFWFAFVLFFAGTGGGKLWDRVWHATHRFDTFWSPPHFFVFFITLLASILIAIMALQPSIRRWFGPTIQLPVIRFGIPGSLIILGSGLTALCVTIMLDNFWHTAFGLDETQWSFPHDSLGWCWFTIIFGFVATRLAFRRYRPTSWPTNIVIAVLILEFMCPPMLGPFYLNYSPHLLHALAHLPIVRTEPDAQHMYRIYLNHGLTRQTSPLFIPMASLFAGTALALLRCIDQRARIFLLAPLFWSLFTMTRDLYTLLFLHYAGATHIQDILPCALAEPSLWIPIPLFIAALLFMFVMRIKLYEMQCYALCGFLFGCCTFAIWHSTLWMALLIVPATMIVPLGSCVGKWLYDMLNEPTLEKLLRFLFVCCAQIPAILGVVDLILRRTTP